MKQLVNRAAGVDLVALRLILTIGAAWLEMPSEQDLRDLARDKESQSDLGKLSDEELDAKMKEVAQQIQALEHDKRATVQYTAD